MLKHDGDARSSRCAEPGGFFAPGGDEGGQAGHAGGRTRAGAGRRNRRRCRVRVRRKSQPSFTKLYSAATAQKKLVVPVAAAPGEAWSAGARRGSTAWYFTSFVPVPGGCAGRRARREARCERDPPPVQGPAGAAGPGAKAQAREEARVQAWPLRYRRVVPPVQTAAVSGRGTRAAARMISAACCVRAGRC